MKKQNKNNYHYNTYLISALFDKKEWSTWEIACRILDIQQELDRLIDERIGRKEKEVKQ